MSPFTNGHLNSLWMGAVGTHVRREPEGFCRPESNRWVSAHRVCKGLPQPELFFQLPPSSPNALLFSLCLNAAFSRLPLQDPAWTPTVSSVSVLLNRPPAGPRWEATCAPLAFFALIHFFRFLWTMVSDRTGIPSREGTTLSILSGA